MIQLRIFKVSFFQEAAEIAANSSPNASLVVLQTVKLLRKSIEFSLHFFLVIALLHQVVFEFSNVSEGSFVFFIFFLDLALQQFVFFLKLSVFLFQLCLFSPFFPNAFLEDPQFLLEDLEFFSVIHLHYLFFVVHSKFFMESSEIERLNTRIRYL